MLSNRKLWPTAVILLLLACDEPPPAPQAADPVGTLRVTHTATGPLRPGPDYVHLLLGQGRVRALPLNGTVSIESLPAGPVTVGIDLLRSHCTVPDDVLTLTIPEADTLTEHLVITCAVNWGALAVELPTSGANQPDLLIVTLDGTAIGGAAPNTAGLEFPYITAGAHAVGLEGMSTNCATAESNPQAVVIPLDETVQVTFTLTCT